MKRTRRKSKEGNLSRDKVGRFVRKCGSAIHDMSSKSKNDTLRRSDYNHLMDLKIVNSSTSFICVDCFDQVKKDTELSSGDATHDSDIETKNEYSDIMSTTETLSDMIKEDVTRIFNSKDV